MNPKTLDELASRIAQALPPGIRELQRDAEKNIRAVLQSALARLDLVTRAEFDVQSEVLARTRAQLATLEKQLAELETQLRSRQQAPDRPLSPSADDSAR